MTSKAMAYAVMAYTVMTYTVIAYTVLAYTVLAYTVMAYVVMAHIVMASSGPQGHVSVCPLESPSAEAESARRGTRRPPAARAQTAVGDADVEPI